MRSASGGHPLTVYRPNLGFGLPARLADNGGEVEVVLGGKDNFVRDAVLGADEDVAVGDLGTFVVEGVVAIIG